jgi:hypothetical protein
MIVSLEEVLGKFGHFQANADERRRRIRNRLSRVEDSPAATAYQTLLKMSDELDPDNTAHHRAFEDLYGAMEKIVDAITSLPNDHQWKTR